MIIFDFMGFSSRILAFFLILSSSFLKAQNRCGAMEFDQFLTQTVAEHGKNRALANEQSLLYQNRLKSADPIIIPVVVHIIYRLPEQNISDEQVWSQLEVLNKDFNKLNWDTMKVPAVWKSLIANCGIEFRLADRDPNGVVTNGITRKQTEIKNLASTFGTRHYTPSQGGTAIWDRNSYLNVWVCEIFGDFYGFSSFPGAPPSSDGIVINFSSFGTIGTAEDPTDLGRTLTHEAGHWFNLSHIWGDANCGDDNCSDTPTQQDPHYGCPAFPKVSCSNAPNGDMFVNFMDYVDDDCMHMFTKCQKDRMLNTLNSSRISLLSSKGYNGIQKNTAFQKNALNLYPNPTSSSLTFQNLPSSQIFEGQIFTMQGQLVYQFRVLENQTSIELPFLHNGLYVLKMVGESEAFTQNFQVQH